MLNGLHEGGKLCEVIALARSKNGSILYQVKERYKEKKAFGQSKHDIRKEGGNEAIKDKIFSRSTFENYLHAGEAFAVWARDEHGCRDLDEARQYTGEYLSWRRDGDTDHDAKSAWTVARDAAAIAKLYGCSSSDLGCDLPTRNREDVTQHREHKWEGHFSEEKNSDLVDLCRSSGLRRREVAALRPEDVTQTDDGRTVIHVRKGKGGKERYVECLDDAPYQIAQAAQGSDHVIEHIPKYAPIHEYRRAYAQTMYDNLARDVDTLPRGEVYACRGSMAGIHLDKRAMRTVSRNLGHNRLEVVTRYLDMAAEEVEEEEADD